MKTSSWNCQQDKTLITHARTQAAKFLGYEITAGHDDRKITRGYRRLNGTIQLHVPTTVITAKCAPYLRRGKPASRPALKDRDDHAIISIYGAEYRGLVQYYLLAGDVWRLDRLEWVMKTSMLKTLAHRHRSTVTKMAGKHKAVIATPHGPRRCFEARIERTAGNHWSHGSAASRSGDSAKRSSMTASQHWPPPAAGS